MTFMDISVRIREERERLGFSQPAFAAIGGATKQTQLRWEQGKTFPDASVLAQWERIGADTQYIISGKRSTAALHPDEEELLTRYRAASLDVRAAAVRALGENGKKDASPLISVGRDVHHHHAKGGRDYTVNTGDIKEKKGK